MLTVSSLRVSFPPVANAQQLVGIRVGLIRFSAGVLATATGLGLLVYYSAGYSPAVYGVIAGCALLSVFVALACRPDNRVVLGRLSVATTIATVVAVSAAGESPIGLLWFVAVVFYAGTILEHRHWQRAAFATIACGYVAVAAVHAAAYRGGAPDDQTLALGYSDVAFAVLAAGFLMRTYGEFNRLVTRSSVAKGNSVAQRLGQARALNDELSRHRAGLERLRRESRAALRAERHATQHLRATREQLEQFAYAASHDLKEPVRTVRSFMQVARRRLPPALAADAELADYFEHVERSSATMHELLEKLLAYSRIERRAGVPAAVALADALAAATRELGDGYEADASLTGVEVVADRKRLGHLLREVVANAVTFARDGVAARLRAEVVPDGAGWVELRLADGGIGIEPAYREQVFGLFRRLHPREAYPGPGLGLALVRRIAEDAGGAAWITGGENGGTVVHVRLARAPDLRATTGAPPSANSDAGAEPRAAASGLSAASR